MLFSDNTPALLSFPKELDGVLVILKVAGLSESLAYSIHCTAYSISCKTLATMDFGNHSPGLLRGDYSFSLLKLLPVFVFFFSSRTLPWDQNITQRDIVPDISESKDFVKFSALHPLNVIPEKHETNIVLLNIKYQNSHF